ncbi:hypothetical protein BGW37DRAFT_521090 [Umbelopsis sp. PMI_123]|nr:hypothetical protein BGW37DRAFT_521090 [Umbelopsis sp. PMI_123]
MCLSLPNSSIWTSSIAALAPEDIQRLLEISEPYINTKVVQKPRNNGTPVYTLGVSNLHELGKALSAEVSVIHIHHDCTSLIQEQRRRQHDLKMRRNIEWITLTTAFSTLFATYWMRNQRFLGNGEPQSVIKSLLTDLHEHVQSLFTSFTITNSSISEANGDSHRGTGPRLSPAAMIANEGITETQSQNGHVRQSSCAFGCAISHLRKNQGTLLLTSTIIASVTIWIRSRHDYVLIKITPTERPKQVEHFLIRQDAVRSKQCVTQKALNALPLCIAAVASSLLIQRTLMSNHR